MNREPQEIVLQGRSVCGHNVVGDTLVSQQNSGVRYDLDPETCLISNRQHDLYGEAMAGRILVFANPKGGVAASWSLASLAERGIAPCAIIFRRASPVFVQGAIFARLSIVHELAQDPCATIRKADRCTLVPSEGCVTVRRSG
ncbi:MAG: DUF126 domain-containing protein [Rhodospirillales bacterium]|nr:DUF126 domain-containing protein [Rhodospirillales bacterium]